MGRRRVNRRQNPSRATSETVGTDDFSSDSESGSPVNIARSETLTLGSMHDSPIRTRNRFSLIQENSSARRESGTNSVDDSGSKQISHDTTPNDADTIPNDTRSQTPHRMQNLTEGSGEPPQSRTVDIAQVNLLLQTFMTRMDRQSEAHTMAIRGCMSQSMSMMIDTCESVKECVKVVADSTQTNFQQLADSTQNNFRQLLGEIREMRDDRAHTAFSLTSSTQNHSLMSNVQ